MTQSAKVGISGSSCTSGLVTSTTGTHLFSSLPDNTVYKPPIFIVGANRSGTTLLRLMLNAHSQIAIPEEMLYFRSHYASARIEDWRNPSLSEADYEEIVQTFVSHAAKLHPELEARTLSQRILENPRRDLRHPFASVLSEWAKSHGKKRWGEKTPGNLFYVDVISTMFPDSYFIYVVRDPRAGVASMVKANFFPQDIILNALTRRKHDRVGLKLLREHIPQNQWLVTRYEDIVQYPERELNRICDMIGERYEPGMLEYYDSATRYMKAEASQSFNAAATKPVMTSKISRWRTQLTPFQIAAVEHTCKEEMRRYSYEPLYPALSIWENVQLRTNIAMRVAYWHWQMWRHQDVRHYTVKHEMFARARSRATSLLSQFTGQFQSDIK